MKTKIIPLEGNKLIAEFMGVIPIYPDKFIFEIPPTSYHTNIEEYTIFQYDSSWEWLMPVIDKIGVMYDNRELISRDVYKLDLIGMTLFASIDNAWLAVVEFIKWYNQNKK